MPMSAAIMAIAMSSGVGLIFGIYPAWKALVSALGVIGKQVHDARLVAICHVHAVTHVLTFNVAHFVRLAGFGPAVVVVDPATV